MGKNNNKDTQVVYRDSKTGEFLTQRQAERKDPATWDVSTSTTQRSKPLSRRTRKGAAAFRVAREDNG
jgi:hypothetical protein